jgi:transposase
MSSPSVSLVLISTGFPIMAHMTVPDSIGYTDGWRGYTVLDVSDFHHFQINHSKSFADKPIHISGIKNFWSQAVRHMRKFNGVPRAHIGLFSKECEWRFNNSDLLDQLSQLRQWVKFHLN